MRPPPGWCWPAGELARRAAAPRLQIVVDVECQIEVVEHLAAAAMQDERAGTIILDDVRHVGCEHQAAIGALIEQFLMRSALKAVVADRDDLVNQVAIEIDGK